MLNTGVTLEELIKKCRTYIPYDVMITFMDKKSTVGLPIHTTNCKKYKTLKKEPEVKLLIPLNCDMTRVIEQRDDKFVTYTVMGTGSNIKWDNLVDDERVISPLELYNFTNYPSAEEIYRQEKLNYLAEDFANTAEEKNLDLTENDYQILAEEYISKQDKSISKKELIDTILRDYTTYEIDR